MCGSPVEHSWSTCWFCDNTMLCLSWGLCTVIWSQLLHLHWSFCLELLWPQGIFCVYTLVLGLFFSSSSKSIIEILMGIVMTLQTALTNTAISLINTVTALILSIYKHGVFPFGGIFFNFLNQYLSFPPIDPWVLKGMTFALGSLLSGTETLTQSPCEPWSLPFWSPAGKVHRKGTLTSALPSSLPFLLPSLWSPALLFNIKRDSAKCSGTHL